MDTGLSKSCMRFPNPTIDSHPFDTSHGSVYRLVKPPAALSVRLSFDIRDCVSAGLIGKDRGQARRAAECCFQASFGSCAGKQKGSRYGYIRGMWKKIGVRQGERRLAASRL